jgi:hypothetical protein
MTKGTWVIDPIGSRCHSLPHQNPLGDKQGLNNLDFSGYNKICPDIAHFEAGSANLGALRHFEGPRGALGTPNQYVSVCMCSPSWYLPISSHLRLNPFRL